MAQQQIVYCTPIIPDFSCLCHMMRCLLLVILGHSVIIGWCEGDQSGLQEIPQLNYSMEYVTTHLQEIPQRIR